MNSLLVKKIPSEDQRIRGNYDRQRKGRVDGRNDSVCERFGCHSDALARFTSSAHFGVLVRRNALRLRLEKGKVSIVDELWNTDKRYKSENHVPIVAVCNERRIPDNFAKASGDRWQIPCARSSGNGSRKVPQSDVKDQENPRQASGGIGRTVAFPKFHEESRSHRIRSVRFGRLLLVAKKENSGIHRRHLDATISLIPMPRHRETITVKRR